MRARGHGIIIFLGDRVQMQYRSKLFLASNIINIKYFLPRNSVRLEKKKLV